MRCPHCDNKLLQKSGTTTRLRITGAIEIDDDGIAKAQCFWCKTRVEIPVELKKAAAAEDVERFTIPVRPSST